MPSKILSAILWDGQKQLKGQLYLEEHRIRFQMLDFADTDLDFDVAYTDIQKVDYHQLYNLQTQGLEIKTLNNRKNIFIVEEPIEVKKAIEKRSHNNIFVKGITKRY